MGGAKQWTVGEVAALAHVTVRTLHHYDAIGLLTPSGRSRAGYRLYSEADLHRLHQVLLYRELGFPLDSIGEVLGQPVLDRRTALLAQRELLIEKQRKTEAIIRAVDRTLESLSVGGTMDTQDMFEGFEALAGAPDGVRAHHAAHARETRERWGETRAYAASMRRAKGYTAGDWERIQKEREDSEARMAALMSEGRSPDGEEARAAAEAMREHIGRWFYPCSHEMHAGLADLYESDDRFRAHYDERAPGLASFVAQAIRANARGASVPSGRKAPPIG